MNIQLVRGTWSPRKRICTLPHIIMIATHIIIRSRARRVARCPNKRERRSIKEPDAKTRKIIKNRFRVSLAHRTHKSFAQIASVFVVRVTRECTRARARSGWGESGFASSPRRANIINHKTLSERAHMITINLDPHGSARWARGVLFPRTNTERVVWLCWCATATAITQLKSGRGRATVAVRNQSPWSGLKLINCDGLSVFVFTCQWYAVPWVCKRLM